MIFRSIKLGSRTCICEQLYFFNLSFYIKVLINISLYSCMLKFVFFIKQTVQEMDNTEKLINLNLKYLSMKKIEKKNDRVTSAKYNIFIWYMSKVNRTLIVRLICKLLRNVFPVSSHCDLQSASPSSGILLREGFPHFRPNPYTLVINECRIQNNKQLTNIISTSWLCLWT